MAPAPAAALPGPLTCPQCRGTDLIVAASGLDNTYVRCLLCGEVWNALRRIEPSQRPTRSRAFDP